MTMPPKTPAPDETHDAALPRRIFGLEIALAVTSAASLAGIAVILWPFVMLANFTGESATSAVVAIAVLALVVAVILDVVLAKTAKRKTSGLLFPGTAIVLGGSVGFALGAAFVELIVGMVIGVFR